MPFDRRKAIENRFWQFHVPSNANEKQTGPRLGNEQRGVDDQRAHEIAQSLKSTAYGGKIFASVRRNGTADILKDDRLRGTALSDELLNKEPKRPIGA